MKWVAQVGLAALLAGACGGPASLPTEPPFPTPSPTPAVSPSVQGCGLPPGGGSGNDCPYEPPLFALQVNESIAELQNEHPEIFDFRDAQGGLSYRVLDRERYHAGIVSNLERKGFCAIFDGEEVGIKNSNSFNEQYQVMTSIGYSRWGGGAYRSTCYPAWF